MASTKIRFHLWVDIPYPTTYLWTYVNHDLVIPRGPKPRTKVRFIYSSGVDIKYGIPELPLTLL